MSNWNVYGTTNTWENVLIVHILLENKSDFHYHFILK